MNTVVVALLGFYVVSCVVLILISYKYVGPRVLWSSWLWPITLMEEAVFILRRRRDND